MEGKPRALWYVAPGQAELRASPVVPLGPGQVRVVTEWSAISRGTERLVASGRVPASEWQRMAAPRMAGGFPFPVMYGYACVGRVVEGLADWVGKRVFCLHPHESAFIATPDALRPVPPGVPARRAVLAANMETALNALWDAGVGPAPRALVVGCGVVGALTLRLLARLPGAIVHGLDPAPGRADLIRRLGGVPVETPAEGWADLVIHASAHADGLAHAIAGAGVEATVLEMSWYGEGTVPAPLGGAFHSRRLRLVASQVGQVAPRRRPRWTYGERLDAALALLDDPVLDALVADATPLDALPQALDRLFTDPTVLCPVVRHPACEEP
jgi:NADPH:quinone reductase-like Zn-dependent oxidoreductase